MREHNIEVKKARADADVLIVTTAVELSRSGPTLVLAEDTDVLILLCYHACNLEPGILIMTSGHRSKRAPWDIGSIINKLGAEICQILPFIHAIGGCDTTSRLYGIGKGLILKKALLSSQLRQLGHVFTKSSATKSEIAAAGEKVLVLIYGGKADERLNILRCRKWSEKVMTSSSPIQVQSLPPTEDAAKYHSYRVYHQVQVWTNVATELNPEHWGWQLSNQKYVAKTMDRPPAPESLLKVIRCSCKGDCNSKQCSCRKHGLACAAGCGECRGISCTNSETVISDDFEDVDDSFNF
ncbi:hypothetical protein SNE40_013838 [Patella caerulea]|uniref:Tesmin/TSO1-like CXC domain-containing protein n=1 Tax=Patella caerulea TaxID=87958 RepID=A0AAN8JJ09_PATCE